MLSIDIGFDPGLGKGFQDVFIYYGDYKNVVSSLAEEQREKFYRNHKACMFKSVFVLYCKTTEGPRSCNAHGMMLAEFVPTHIQFVHLLTSNVHRFKFQRAVGRGISAKVLSPSRVEYESRVGLLSLPERFKSLVGSL